MDLLGSELRQEWRVYLAIKLPDRAIIYIVVSYVLY